LQFDIGDTDFDNHETQITVRGESEQIRTIAPRVWEFMTISHVVETEQDFLEIHFTSPTNNWIVNALSIEPAESLEPTSYQLKRLGVYENRWNIPPETGRGVRAMVDIWRRFAEFSPDPCPTLINRNNYLSVIRSGVRCFESWQDGNGAIIDPYKQVEYQYSTPCFAYLAALVAVEDSDSGLMERAARAFEWSANSLAKRSAPNRHEDFFTSPLAHAFALLSPHMDGTRVEGWRTMLASMDPYEIYRVRVGGPDGPGSNWNCLSLAGESILHSLGIRESIEYVEESLGEQGRFFQNEFGLYSEGPLIYDAFSRGWLEDMLSHGYGGRYRTQLVEALERAGLASLLLQSPNGDLACGGRSSQHVWGEALEVLLFESRSDASYHLGDIFLAGVYKRAARRSFASILKWQRPEGDFSIVKNYVPPITSHGFEASSSHSQYNMLMLTALGYAYERAGGAEEVAEKTTPTESGHYVLTLSEPFFKIIASCAGTQIIIVTKPEPQQSAMGLIRVQFLNCISALGPSEGLVLEPSFLLPGGPRINASIGVAWTTENGLQSLADILHCHEVKSDVQVLQVDPWLCRLKVEYCLSSDLGPTVIEAYSLSPNQVNVEYNIGIWDGDLFLRFLIFAGDGKNVSAIQIGERSVDVELCRKNIRYVVLGTESITVSDLIYPHRNGYMKLALAKIKANEKPQLVISCC
jgi:hypothetical protein